MVTWQDDSMVVAGHIDAFGTFVACRLLDWHDCMMVIAGCALIAACTMVLYTQCVPAT